MMSSGSGASVSALYSDFSLCIFHYVAVNKKSFRGYKIFSQHQQAFNCYQNFPCSYISRKLMTMGPSRSTQYLLSYIAISYYRQSVAGYPQRITRREDDGKMILEKECDGMDWIQRYQDKVQQLKL